MLVKCINFTILFSPEKKFSNFSIKNLEERKKGVILQPVLSRKGKQREKFFEKFEDSQEVANAPKE